MPNKILDAISARKKQIIWILVIIGLFYLFSVWNVGSILSFLAFYDYGFAFLATKLGLNEWLARGILIPATAATVWAISAMLSITSKEKREIGTVALVLLLSSFSFAIYNYTVNIQDGKDYAGNTRLFNGSIGVPNFNYYTNGEQVDLFPVNVKQHPSLGFKLQALSSQALESFRGYSIGKSEKHFSANTAGWTSTGYYVLRGDKLNFIEEENASGIDLFVRIGENESIKLLPFNVGNGRKNSMIADSDGVLFIKAAEEIPGFSKHLAHKEVLISGLFMRLYR